MSRPRGSWFAWILGALPFAIVGVLFAVATSMGRAVPRSGPEFALAISVFGVVGAFIVARRPSNPIGLLMASVAITGALAAMLEAWAETKPALPAQQWAAWLNGWIWAFGLGSLVAMLQLFPHGALLGRRWRVGIWLTVAALVTFATGAALSPGPLGDHPDVTNPVGVEAIRHTPLNEGTLGFALLSVALLVAVTSVIVRFKRSSGETRAQLKWLSYAGGLMAVAWLIVATHGFGIGSGRISLVGDVVLYAALIGLPIAVGIAILKYRLYDIDVVINKTLVYGSLAAFITAVYVGVVVGIGSAFGRGDQPNLGLSILATAVVAMAFQPFRERVQRLANRLVYGRRAAPYEVLARFSQGLAGTSELDDLLPRLARLLAQGTGARSAQVWLRVGDRLQCEATWPRDADRPTAMAHRGEADPEIPGAARTVPVRHRGELLGAVALTKAPGDPLTPADDKLLTDVASQAGLVLRNVRLVEELRASRQRIVAAQDEERRKLERDIHDGAQQQLVALALGIRMADARLGVANRKLSEALNQASEELKQALAELRELARGIHPAILTERGLEAAVKVLAERSPVPVRIDSTLQGRRLDPTVEATAYFAAAEALTNVAKYAGATVVEARLDASGADLVVEVSDDGVGGADPLRGSGLRGLMDRVAAVDGSLDVESPSEHGTRLSCRIPLRYGLQSAPVEVKASVSAEQAKGEAIGEPAFR